MERWQLRREARRCSFSAITAERAAERSMFEGFARFYDDLAASEPVVIAKSGAPKRSRHDHPPSDVIDFMVPGAVDQLAEEWRTPSAD
jgi:hypothetical protein